MAFLALAEPIKFPVLKAGGKEYKDAVVTAVEADGIKITHAAGIARIPFEKLEKEIQRIFGYDPDEARRARQNAEDDKREAARLEGDQPWASYAKGSESKDKSFNRRSQMKSVLPLLKEVCAEFLRGPSDKQEAKEKALREWCDMAANEKIATGMPEVFVILAWGNPERTSTFSAGIKILHYGTLTHSQTVTISEGVVKSWSTYE